MKLSVKQYRDGIINSLSSRQVEVLQILYSFPDSSATATQLAKALSPSAAAIVGAGAIGRIGKTLSDYLDFVPELYFDRGRDRPSFYSVIGPYTEDGYEMLPNLKKTLEDLKLVNESIINDKVIQRLPTETLSFDEQKLYKEGKVTQVFVDKYERNQNARLKCISHHGDNCYVCDFDFGKFYGEIAKGFIHVHHKNQLSDIKQEYQLDPIQDLIPICANCHSVIHLRKPPMTISDLKSKVRRMKKKAD